jgi:hypothetical protein
MVSTLLLNVTVMVAPPTFEASKRKVYAVASWREV